MSDEVDEMSAESRCSHGDTLVPALRILARDIHCEDGVATQCISDAADQMERQVSAIKSLRRALFDLFEHIRKRHPPTMSGHEYPPSVADKMQRASAALEATDDYGWQG